MMQDGLAITIFNPADFRQRQKSHAQAPQVTHNRPTFSADADFAVGMERREDKYTRYYLPGRMTAKILSGRGHFT
jgi:hypothetical protein